MLPEMFLRPFGLLLNHGLARSTSAQAVARELEGRILGLTVEGTPIDLRLRVAGGGISITLPDGAAPDATLGGTLLGLGRLLRDDPQAAIREGAVRIGGDTGIAGRFRDLLRFAAPDLEEELGRLVGDPLARHAGDAARALGGWGAAARRDLLDRTSDYLQNTTRMVPTTVELTEFARAVDTLVDDVARAEARVARLEEDRRR